MLDVKVIRFWKFWTSLKVIMDTSESELVTVVSGRNASGDPNARSTEAPGVNIDSDPMEHIEKRRRTNGNGDKASNTTINTNDLLVTIINKLDETNKRSMI